MKNYLSLSPFRIYWHVGYFGNKISKKDKIKLTKQGYSFMFYGNNHFFVRHSTQPLTLDATPKGISKHLNMISITDYQFGKMQLHDHPLSVATRMQLDNVITVNPYNN